jgi:DNA-binding ferritin-like protein
LPLGLSVKAREEMVQLLNQILADTATLRDLYKKSHWQVSGPTFYQLHLLFDKHYEEQDKLVDEIAERIQLLGGISIAMAHDVAEITGIQRPPRGREEVPVQISRLLERVSILVPLRTSRCHAPGVREVTSEPRIPGDRTLAELVREDARASMDLVPGEGRALSRAFQREEYNAFATGSVFTPH